MARFTIMVIILEFGIRMDPELGVPIGLELGIPYFPIEALCPLKIWRGAWGDAVPPWGEGKEGLQ